MFLTIGCKIFDFCRISVWQLFHYLWPHQPFSFTYFCRFSNYHLVTFPFVLTFHFIPKYHLFFQSITQIGCLLFTVLNSLYFLFVIYSSQRKNWALCCIFFFYISIHFFKYWCLIILSSVIIVILFYTDFSPKWW